MRKIVLSVLTILLLSLTAMAQNQRVSGTVTDPAGEPIVGVAVVLKGTNVVAITNIDGQYSINVPGNSVLEVSYLGMVTQEISVSGRSVINIEMRADTQAIDEVIVVAFGTQRREAFAGSAATVKAEDIAKRTTTNVVNSLAGQLPGVQIRNANGQPGQEAAMRIRGFTSLNAENTPLIIVDGAPYTGNLSSINNSDIETFTVLKDAASSALYGARAANGVILITTKRARRSEAIITVDAKVGVGTRAAVDYELIQDPAAHYELFFSGLYNYHYRQSGQASHAASETWANGHLINTFLLYNVYDTKGGALIVDGKLNPNATLGNVITGADGNSYYLTPDSWKDAAYKNSLRQEYNVSVNGGTERSGFYLSVGWLDDQGIVEKSYYKRFTARLKADYQAKKWLKLGGNVAYANTSSSVASGYDSGGLNSGNIFAFTASIAPIYPLFMRDGTTKEILVDERGMKRYDYGDAKVVRKRPFLPQGNAISAVLLDDDSSTGNLINMTGNAQIQFMKGLTLDVTATGYVNETRANTFTNPFYGQYASSEGSLTKSHRRYFGVNFVQQLNYENRIDKHNFRVSLGHESYDYTTTYLYGSKDHMFGVDVHELSAAVNVVNTTSNMTKYNTEGYFLNAQYDFDNKYFLTGSFRRDATSRFHPDHRWGNFWSFSGGWLMHKESFMQNADWIDMLKFKASYGMIGNDRIGDFRYTDQYEIVNSNGSAGVITKSKGNKNITWETNANFNVGFDFDFFKGRLSGSAEYYNRMTYDLLFSRPVSQSAGYSSYFDNIGDMKNEGFEVSLMGTLVRTQDINLTLHANITRNWNKMVTLPPENMASGNGFATGAYWIAEGGTIYDWYLPEYAGVNEQGQSTWWVGPVDDSKKRADGERTTTTVYDSATKYRMETASPKYYGGFGLSFYAYGFDLSVNLDYQLGGKTLDSVYASYMRNITGSTDNGTAWHKDILDAWSADNTGSNIPRFSYNDQNANASSSRFLIDASYLNLQNINLGYTIPQHITRKISVNSIRIYCSAENIAYWSKRKGLDTRQSWNGSTRNSNYSPIRTISGGVQFTF